MRRLYELMTGLSSAVWIHQHGTPSLKTNLPCNDFFG